MLFAPARLGNTTLGREELAADRKSCKRFGPCGVGEKALYLNSFFIDRHYYVALSSVRRVFKRVAMSKGGFSGKGAFGSIPYLVVEYDGGQVKQCTFKHEDDVDRMIECIARYLPDIPLHSEKVERHLAEQEAEKAQRYVRNLTADAETTRAQLEQAMALLEENYADETAELSRAAKAKRVNDHTNPAYKWVALAIVIAGAAAMVYGIITLIRGGGVPVFGRARPADGEEQPRRHHPRVGAGGTGARGQAARGLPRPGALCPPHRPAPDDPHPARGARTDRARSARGAQGRPEGAECFCAG